MSLVNTADSIIGDVLAPYALISSPSRSIGTLMANVTVQEMHSDEYSITDHPVETGTTISDHCFALPQVVEIRCGWSDSTGGFPGYVQQVYQELLAQQRQREPFSVSTGKRQYSSMLMQSLNVVTDATSENTLMVVARCRQIIITSTDGTAAPGSDAATSSQTASGNQEEPQVTGPDDFSGVQMATSVSSAPTSEDLFSQMPLTPTNSTPLGGS